MNFPVFDMHCDTALGLLGANYRSCGSLKSNDLHIDLTRAKTLPGYAQCFACFTSPLDCPPDLTPVQIFEREMASVLRELERNHDVIRQAYTAKEIESNRQKGLMSAILTIEGPAGFDYDPELLQDLYLVGFRMSNLCWNEKNPLTGSHETGGGLTDQGREYVKEAQRLGMIVDVSHISDEAFWDIMDMTQSTVIASHSNSRSVHGASRNLTDDMFKAICNTGGVAGLNLHIPFVGGKEDLDAACDHVFHFLEMDPSGKHIGLGSDMDGSDQLTKGFCGVQDYPLLAQRLSQRGLDNMTLQNIFWNNAIGVIERCCI